MRLPRLSDDSSLATRLVAFEQLGLPDCLRPSTGCTWFGRVDFSLTLAVRETRPGYWGSG